ncbi:F-box only 22 [Pelobates cultripes]|uniref:F-box only 22 n=1 Tax=Pelobates cultripes TaxID=61616 RepID=A0AAD1RK70_PELCU|nr:F-box only 22 [Pelobates cultripes]
MAAVRAHWWRRTRAAGSALWVVVFFPAGMAGAGFDPLGEVVDGSELRVVSSLDSQGHCVLSNLAEVVERVLSFLPIKPLLRASCVCRLWRNCALRKLKARQRIAWVSYTEDTGDLPSTPHPLSNVVKRELEHIYVLPHIFLYVTDSLILQTDGNDQVSKRGKMARQAVL